MLTRQMKSTEKNNVEQWVYTYGDGLFSWAYHKTNDKSIAEDLVQETFLAAHKSFDSFKGESSPKTWLFRIINNKIIDHYRKTSHKTITYIEEEEKKKITDSLFDKYDNWSPNGLESAWQEDQHLLDNPEFNNTMDQCMSILPSSWKTAVLLKYHLGKESKEICRTLGITPSNYWQILHRAKLLLKKCLEKKWFSI